MTVEKEKIIESMMPLFNEAIEKKLWFYCSYQGLWFSPRQLFESMHKGSFCWGPPNWTLREPIEFIKEKKQTIVNCLDSIYHVYEECSKPFVVTVIE